MEEVIALGGAGWRARLLLRLATARAAFLLELLGLEEAVLVGERIFDEWTPKDLIAHVAAWDELFAGRIELILEGREDEIVGVEADEQNAVFYQERRNLSLAEAVGALGMARADFLAALSRLSDDEIRQQRHFPWGDASVASWVQLAYEHDEEHGHHLHLWREEGGLGWNVGPKPLLLAAQAAARQEVLIVAALLPPDERTTRPVCGIWALRDLLGHIADWEFFCADALRRFLAGETDRVLHDGDYLAWNNAQAAARQDQPWAQVWADFQQAHRQVTALLQGLSQADLARRFPNPWDENSTVYFWLATFVSHDHGHAQDLRKSLEL